MNETIEPQMYEPIGRPSTTVSNSSVTASFTINKKNNIYRNQIMSFEYVVSLTANSGARGNFSLTLDIEEILTLATSINLLRAHAQAKVGKSKYITIASRNKRNFTLQFNDMSTEERGAVAKAYFNLSQEQKFYLPLGGNAVSVIYAKCIETLSLNHNCSPSDLFVFYPSLKPNI